MQACSPQTTGPVVSTTVLVPEASALPPAPMATLAVGAPISNDSSTEIGRKDARGAGPFAPDEVALNLDVGCKGDCPSPFEMAATRKDSAQVQARLDWCAKAAQQRHAVPDGTVTLRALVSKEGRTHELKHEPGASALPDDVAACLDELVSKAHFTPPQSGEDRPMYASATIGSKPEP